MDIYDSTNNNWSIASLSQAREALASTSVGSKAFFAGGFRQQRRIAVSWTSTMPPPTPGPPPPSPRHGVHLAATTAGNKAFFAGGYGNSGVSNVVDIYDGDSGLWLTSSLSQARYDLAAASAGGQAIFAGGRTGSI